MSKVFTSICKMSQPKLKKYVTDKLRETHGVVTVGDGYVYAQGKFPVLLVAHMDTVHLKLPQQIVYDMENGSYSSPQGIGGDDRCGIYMVLEIVKKYNCSVLFCEDEEIGAVGAKKFTEAEFTKTLKFNYIIEFDRKGKNDAVFYDCDNPEFCEFIVKDFYKAAWGSFSDISVLAPFLGCAAVNLSCGYYKAHTKDEYVVMQEMKESIYQACQILERTTEADRFEYIEAVHSYYYGGGWYDWGDEDYSKKEKYYVLEFVNKNGDYDWYDVMATSTAEAIGRLCMEYPSLSYDDILDVYAEENVYA